MHIHLSEAFKKYLADQNVDSLVVGTHTPLGGFRGESTIDIQLGEPVEHMEEYSIFCAEGITFYITKKIKIQSEISFDCTLSAGRNMFEMAGYEIIPS
jgi:hypothetical protein